MRPPAGAVDSDAAFPLASESLIRVMAASFSWFKFNDFSESRSWHGVHGVRAAIRPGRGSEPSPDLSPKPAAVPGTRRPGQLGFITKKKPQGAQKQIGAKHHYPDLDEGRPYSDPARITGSRRCHRPAGSCDAPSKSGSTISPPRSGRRPASTRVQAESRLAQTPSNPDTGQAVGAEDAAAMLASAAVLGRTHLQLERAPAAMQAMALVCDGPLVQRCWI